MAVHPFTTAFATKDTHGMTTTMFVRHAHTPPLKAIPGIRTVQNVLLGLFQKKWLLFQAMSVGAVPRIRPRWVEELHPAQIANVTKGSLVMMEGPA